MSKSNKNIVLDIDATLAHTHGDLEDFNFLNLYSDPEKLKYRRKLYSMKLFDVSCDPGSGYVIKLAGMYRPYLREFLDFCFDYFDNVVIWSAGKKKYVEKMCQLMFPLENQPLNIYTYDDCIIGEEDYLKKPLKKIYKQFPKLNEKNTFILDDREDTFSLNESNGIQIPEFESNMTLSDISSHDDICLLQIMAWFSLPKNKSAKDIRKLDKENIFNKSLNDYKKLLRN